MVGGVIWDESGGGTTTRSYLNYRRVAATGVPAGFEAWFGPLGIWFFDVPFRTEGGLVVTYDDVTERRRIDEERAVASHTGGRRAEAGAPRPRLRKPDGT